MIDNDYYTIGCYYLCHARDVDDNYYDVMIIASKMERAAHLVESYIAYPHQILSLQKITFDLLVDKKFGKQE